jgi:hypothetical protein
MPDISTGQATVTTTAAVIIPYNLDGKQVQIKNTGATTVYIGGVNVTPATGYPIAAGEAPFPFPVSEPIYGVVASGTGTIAYADANN